MQELAQAFESRPSHEDFAAMLDESLGSSSRLEGSVVKGTVVDIHDHKGVVGLGRKSQGRVPHNELAGK